MKEKIYYYYVIEISGDDHGPYIYDTHDEALTAAMQAWEDMGEEYSEDLTWIKTIRYKVGRCKCKKCSCKERTPRENIKVHLQRKE